MARARNIKPSFFKNEDLGAADPLVGLLFISLWTLADKAGRLEDRPLRIKAETFPYRENININGYLTELVSLGLIERYVTDGKAVISIVNFAKHQTPHSTEKASELPAKSIDQPAKTIESTITVKQPLNNASACVTSNINVLIPDSLNLIPDSLIPDCGVMNVESAKKPAQRVSRAQRPPDPLAVNWNQILQEHGVSQQTAADYLTVRKAKKAAMTKTALDRLIAEAGKAGITLDAALEVAAAKGWQGFEAGWYANMQQASAAPQPRYGGKLQGEALEAHNRAVGDAWEAKKMREFENAAA